MIRYSLKCDCSHTFESWFQSAEAFDALARAGHLSCPVCGSSDVSKSLMAPQVQTGDEPVKKTRPSKLDAPETPLAKALADLRQKVEASSDYVGVEFAREARAMHDGEVPHRPIYGEAHRDDARKLLEDGVPVAPLPFTPRAKTN